MFSKHSADILAGHYKKNIASVSNKTTCDDFSAEREGFEPPEPRSSTVFKTAVIDHSTTSPDFVPSIEGMQR